MMLSLPGLVFLTTEWPGLPKGRVWQCKFEVLAKLRQMHNL